MNKPEKLILDYSTWRCGGDGDDNKLGDGDTLLLNECGFSCCLGQWSKQMGALDDHLLGVGDPVELDYKIDIFINEETGYFNSSLANDCIEINDDPLTSPEQKIHSLRLRLSLEGIELEVINKP